MHLPWVTKLFEFQVSPWELIIRGTVIYWFLFVLFRFLLRRDSGTVGLADILVVVVIADAAQNGMSGEYKTLSEAMVLIGTIVGWNYFIDWMSFRYRWFAAFAEPRVITLVQEGRILRKNIARELITEDELKSQLRQSGIEDVASVRRARLEPDGHISVITYKASSDRHRKSGRPGAA